MALYFIIGRVYGAALTPVVGVFGNAILDCGIVGLFFWDWYYFFAIYCDRGRDYLVLVNRLLLRLLLSF